jgi:hypothetical protein
VVLGLAVSLVVTGLAAAQDKIDAGKKVTDKKTNDGDKKAKPSPNARTIQDLELANQLIRYGRQEKNAEALLLAAQILHRTPTSEFKAEVTFSGKGAENPRKAMKVDNSPRALVAEAKKLASTPHIEALATATQKILDEKSRDPAAGLMTDAFTIRPMQAISWNSVAFKANEKAEVCVSTGIPSSMILEVTDENGHLVTRDSVPGTFYRCTWTPRSAGNFRIRLISDDNLPLDCKMYVNQDFTSDSEGKAPEVKKK